MFEKLARLLARLLALQVEKHWYALCDVGNFISTLARKMRNWHAFGTLASCYVNHAGTQACWHVDYFGTQARGSANSSLYC